jgi:nucleotide-binding universal stress UspA family protein
MQEPMKIMIAYDGSPRADAALRGLQYAGLPRLAEVKLISVIEPWLTAVTPDAALGAPLLLIDYSDTQQAKQIAQEGTARLHQAFPDWACGTTVRRGNRSLQILAEAERWKPELIVISPLNRNQFARLLLGSFSRKVVSTASCSVRVARPAVPNEGRGLRLLLGYDASRGAAAAVCEVGLRRWPSNTEVRLVMVSDAAILSNPTPAHDVRLRNELLAGAADFLCESGLRVSLSQREGVPKQILLKEAERWGAHCIFVGRSQRNGWNRLLLGDTSAAIATQAHCTVEVVREGVQRSLPARHVVRARTAEIAAQVTAH